MAMVEINWNPSRKELRQFAAILLAVGIFFGGMEVYRTGALDLGHWFWGRLSVIAACVGALGVAAPMLLRPLYVGWMVLAFPIGWTVSHLLLGAMYYFILTPFGWVVRATGNDPMKREFDREAKTYWVEHRTGDDPATYFRQF